MRPEIGSIVGRKVSKKEFAVRSIATVLVAGSAVIGGSTKKVEASGYHLSSKDSWELVKSTNIELQPVYGPQAPSSEQVMMQADREFRVGIESAQEQALQAKLTEEKAQQEEKEAARDASVSKIAPHDSPTVTAQEASGETTTKNITGYYCEYDTGYYGDGGGFCGTMADGTVVHNGAAACGPSYPLGTVFQIEGYGEVTCEDRGGGVPDNHIDVFTYFSSGLSSIPVGRRNVVQIK